MPFDEISNIKTAEEEAQKTKSLAQAEADAAVADAKKAGAALLEDSVKRAETESALLLSKAEGDAAAFAKKTDSDTATERSRLRSAAEAKMDAAAAIIVKKVVEG